MMRRVYDMVLWLALLVMIPYHLFRSFTRKRPAALAARFGFVSAAEVAPVAGAGAIWIHAVSVGETIAVKSLLKALKGKFPDRKIVLSNGTETGRRVALAMPEIDLCIYFPFDCRFAVRRLLGRIRPSVVLIVETEIWPNFLRTAREMGIPAVMVNGRISDRSIGRYLSLRWFFSKILGDFAWFCMQTDEDARRIIMMGAPAAKVNVTRNLKYDLPVISCSPAERAKLRSDFRIPPGLPLFTAGSTHQGEEEIAVSAYKRLLSDGRQLLMILAPRHPERVPQVAELLRSEGVPFTLRSQLDAGTGVLRSGEVLLVDTIGELMRFYRFADVAFVGGSLVPAGGHNVLEPASLQVPVLFGPYMNNFREVARLVIEYGGGIQVGDGEELAEALQSLLLEEEKRRVMGENGGRLMADHSGSTARHLQVVERLLEDR